MPFLILLISYFPLLALRAWVGLTLYNWFLLPIGAPGINLVHAMGVMILLSLIQSTKDKDLSDVEDAVEAIIISVLKPLIVLFFGWVTTFWL